MGDGGDNLSENQTAKNSTNAAENSVSTKKKKKINSKRLIIPIYLLIVILLIFIVYVYPMITGVFTKTMTAEYGNLKVSENVTCYIIKNETLYFANDEGDINYFFDEGTLARSGAEILNISPATINENAALGKFEDHAQSFASGQTFLNEKNKNFSNILSNLTIQRSEYAEGEDEVRLTEIDRYIDQLNGITKSQKQSDSDAELSELGLIPENYVVQKPGIVSYMLDGYESELSPYTMELLDPSKMASIDAQSKDVSRKTTRYGEPLFKIVDNSAWYAVMWIEERDLGKYSEGNTVSLKLPNGDADGTIMKVSENDGEIMVIMKFTAYYDDIASLRKVQTEIVTSDYSGLMIKNSFIGSEDGVTGVYVVGITGESKFVPIKIKATDGEYSLVESGTYYEYDETTGESIRFDTIEVYDEIEKP